MFQLTKPSVKPQVCVSMGERECVCVCLLMCVLLMSSAFAGVEFETKSLYCAHIYKFIVIHLQTSTESSQKNVNALSLRRQEGGRWARLGLEWIRMATHVAQLLLKGLFITVRSPPRS